MAPSPFLSPTVSPCVRCGRRAATPFTVTGAGAARALVRLRCRQCWAEWTEMRTMPGHGITRPMNDDGHEWMDREQDHV